MTPHFAIIAPTLTKINIVCMHCNTEHSVLLPTKNYLEWKNGTPIQCAFPEMDTDTRALLISGICGTCFDSLVGD